MIKKFKLYLLNLITLLALASFGSACGNDSSKSAGGPGQPTPNPSPTLGQRNCPPGYIQTPSGCQLDHGNGNGGSFEQNCVQTGGYITQSQGRIAVCRHDYDIWKEAVLTQDTSSSYGTLGSGGSVGSGLEFGRENGNDGYPQNWGFGNYQRRRRFTTHARISEFRPGDSIPRLLQNYPTALYPRELRIQGQPFMARQGDRLSFKGKGGFGYGRFNSNLYGQNSLCPGVNTSSNVESLVVGVVSGSITPVSSGGLLENSLQSSFEEILSVQAGSPIYLNSNGLLVWGFAVSPYERANCFDVRQTHFVISRCEDQTGSTSPCL